MSGASGPVTSLYRHAAPACVHQPGVAPHPSSIAQATRLVFRSFDPLSLLQLPRLALPLGRFDQAFLRQPLAPRRLVFSLEKPPVPELAERPRSRYPTPVMCTD